MKILHLTTYPHGGAGVAAARLVETLNRHVEDVEASLLCKNDICCAQKRGLFSLPAKIKRKIADKLLAYAHSSNCILHSIGWHCKDIVPVINKSDADIVHLHWINHDFLSIRDIARIRKPLVWTLHDSWVVCGTEHHPNFQCNDDRWRNGYLKSNFPETSSGIDLDRLIWLWKKHCWKNLNITFTAPSRWESSILTESALFKGMPCHVVPNCTDTDVFTPKDKNQAKTALGIDKNYKVILFGANFQNDPIKGINFLTEALQKLKDKENLLLLCFGHNFDFKQFEVIGLPVLNLGNRNGDANLAAIYQAADVFACPSIIDNLPNTCVEASACGTPVVAFNIGGIPDVVIHKETGYLAKPYCTDDLAEGIEYCLQNRPPLGEQARLHAEKKFNYQTVALQFAELYRSVLE